MLYFFVVLRDPRIQLYVSHLNLTRFENAVFCLRTSVIFQQELKIKTKNVGLFRVGLTLWRRNYYYFFLILAHPVHKM
jgi:hypothetical protein